MKRVTLVLENEDLYRAIKVEAVRHNRRIQDVVQEAMALWLEAQEDADDLAAAEEALSEEGPDIEAKQFFRELAGKNSDVQG